MSVCGSRVTLRRSAASNLCKPARPGPRCALRRLVGAGAGPVAAPGRPLGPLLVDVPPKHGPPRRRRPSARRSTSRRRARGSCGSRAASPDAGRRRPDDPRLRQAFVERPFVRDDPLLRAVRLEQGDYPRAVRLRGLVRPLSPARVRAADRARARDEQLRIVVPSPHDAGRAWAREANRLGRLFAAHRNLAEHVTSAAADDIEPAWDGASRRHAASFAASAQARPTSCSTTSARSTAAASGAWSRRTTPPREGTRASSRRSTATRWRTSGPTWHAAAFGRTTARFGSPACSRSTAPVRVQPRAARRAAGAPARPRAPRRLGGPGRAADADEHRLLAEPSACTESGFSLLARQVQP